MKSLIVGVITQLCILLSILFMFKTPAEQGGYDACFTTNRGAQRGILVFSQGFGSLDGRARGAVDYNNSLVQFEETYPVLAGIPDHAIRISEPSESILDKVYVVVYGGPSGVMEPFDEPVNYYDLTYPRSWLSGGNCLRNDLNVFLKVHDLLRSAETNETMKDLFSKKALFILYLTSLAMVRTTYPLNTSEVYRTEFLLRGAMTDMESHMNQYYSDKETIFVTVPHWSIKPDKDPKLGVWGRGSSYSFCPTIKLVDVCPLLSALLGIPVPSGSVGRLPLQYLKMTRKEEATAIAENALQIHKLVFSDSDTNPIISNLLNSVLSKDYDKGIALGEEMIRASLSEIYKTPKTFDRTIYFTGLFALIGWMSTVLTEPITVGTDYLPKKHFFAILISFVTFAFTLSLYITFAWYHSVPYVVFMQLSLLPWFLLVTRYKLVWYWLKDQLCIETLLYVISLVLLEEILVHSFEGGFFSIFLISVFGSLPLLCQFRKTPFVYCLIWFLCCTLVVGFISFPRELVRTRTRLLNGAATLWMCYGQSSVFFFNITYEAIIAQILVAYMFVSTIIANAAIYSQFLPDYAYYISWFMFTALIFPFFGRVDIVHRLIKTSLSFGPSLLLLSKDIESVSFAVLMVFVTCWVFLEGSFKETHDEPWCDLRRGVLLVLSCSVGYQLVGKIQEHAPSTLLAPFLPLHVSLNSPSYFYGFLFFKYFAFFTITMVVYYQLIVKKYKKDFGFVFGLFLVELVCLRFMLKMLLFNDDHDNVVYQHFFTNLFALSFMLSYCLGSVYSNTIAKWNEKEPKVVTNEGNA